MPAFAAFAALVRRRGAGLALVVGLALAFAGAAWGQSVALTGTIGNRAILVVDGGAPRTVAVGSSVQGVRLLAVQDEQATVEAGGQRYSLRMDAPVSVGGSGGGGAGGQRIVLTMGSGGHFTGQALINGKPVSFMLDTGASVVALSQADAQRIGLDYQKGETIGLTTANGTVPARRVRLDSVRVGDVEVYGVDAIVSPQPMPWVLLGNSFTGRFSMRRDADQMVLEKRY